jgi:hypothetical protein
MTELHQEIIVAYRNLVSKRYNFEILKQREGFPASFDKARVDRFKAYFLDYLYPAPEARKELNMAFEGLDAYIKHPNKLLMLLLDSSSLLLKYGRHLPQILKTGIHALQSFRKANTFEEKLVLKALVQRAEDKDYQIEANDLIRHLSPNEIEDFIESGANLFETLKNRPLVSRIKIILDSLIQKMRKRPQTFTETDLKALIMGKEIIEIGDTLFAELSPEEQDKIFVFIIDMEREELSKIFNKKGS